jgi:hypothetical protein
VLAIFAGDYYYIGHVNGLKTRRVQMKKLAALVLCITGAVSAFGFTRVVLGELVTSTS